MPRTDKEEFILDRTLTQSERFDVMKYSALGYAPFEIAKQLGLDLPQVDRVLRDCRSVCEAMGVDRAFFYLFFRGIGSPDQLGRLIEVFTTTLSDSGIDLNGLIRGGARRTD